MTLIADKMGFVYAVHPSLPILECSVSYFAVDEWLLSCIVSSLGSFPYQGVR